MTSNYPLPVDGFAPPAAPTAPLPMSPPPSGRDETSTAAVAKDQAASVGQSAAEAGQQVAAVAKDQAGQVAAEAGRQAKDLLGQAQGQLSEQAGAQQEKLVKALQTLRDELRSMAQNADQPGVGSDMARQAADRAGTIAGWLDGREPAALLDDVTAFARRRPGAFLAAAGGIGLLAGRLTSGIKAQPSTSEQTAVTTPPVTSTLTTPSTPPVYSPPIAVAPAVGLTPPLAPLAPPVTALPTNGYLGEMQP